MKQNEHPQMIKVIQNVGQGWTKPNHICLVINQI
jgi:hypothetical protein